MSEQHELNLPTGIFLGERQELPRIRKTEYVRCLLLSFLLVVTTLSIALFAFGDIEFTSPAIGLLTGMRSGGPCSRPVLKLSPKPSKSPDCLLLAMVGHFQDMCYQHTGTPHHLSWPLSYKYMSQLLEDDIYERYRSEAFAIGYEAWDWMTIDEIHDSYGCANFPFPRRCEGAFQHYELKPFTEDLDMIGSEPARLQDGARPLMAKTNISDILPPAIYATFSKKKIQRKSFQEAIYHDYLGIPRSLVKWTNFGEVEDAMRAKEWIASRVFHAAKDLEPSAIGGSLLSTLTAFRFLEELAAGEAEYALYLEDDARPVFRFWDKYRTVMSEVNTLYPEWDMVMLGTCLGIHYQLGSRLAPRPKEGSSLSVYQKEKHAPSVRTGRCFNALLLTKSAAQAILSTGVVSDTYLPIDHSMDVFIKQLGLRVLWAQPPLFFEASKVVKTVSCQG